MTSARAVQLGYRVTGVDSSGNRINNDAFVVDGLARFTGTTTGSTALVTDDLGYVCITCSSYLRPSLDRTMCIEACAENERVLSSGFCEACPANHVLSNDRRSCILICGDRQKKVGNTCVNCPAYTRPSRDGLSCFSDCRDGQKVLESGFCETCPTGYILSNDRRTCLVVCTDRQRKENNYCITCPAYTRPSNDRLRCINNCSANQKVLETGYCQTCPTGSIVTEDRRYCEV